MNPASYILKTLTSIVVGGNHLGLADAVPGTENAVRVLSKDGYRPGGATGGGGNYANNPLGLPPQLRNMKTVPNANSSIPDWARADAVSSVSRGMAGEIASGINDGAINQSLAYLGGHGQGNPLSTGLSPTQGQMLESIEDPAARKRMMIQFALQNQAEVAAFVSNVMKLIHEMSMGIIRNIQH